MTETDDSTVQRDTSETVARLGKGIDWAVSAILVLGGLLLALGGFFLNRVADRTLIAELVAEGTIQSTMLSPAELVDVSYALAWWGGVGLAVVGLFMFVGGVAFFFYRRRIHRRRAEIGVTGPDTTTNAIVGAIVTVVTSFVPLSPILGGIVAGYLQRGERMGGARVGSFSGLVAAAPVVLLFVSLIIGLFGVSTELGAGLEASLIAVVFAVSAIVTVLYMVVLSAIGGYLGVYLYEKRGPTDDGQTPAA